MNEEAIKALYESVSADYEVGTIDEFKAYLSDDTKRGKFFEDVIKPEYDVESIDEFETTYGLKKKPILLWRRKIRMALQRFQGKLHYRNFQKIYLITTLY